MLKFGDNSKPYPADMRRQLWPLCCGASIISGFKKINTQTPVDEIVKQINDTITQYVPDHQVYAYETICPKLTYLTLNQQQAGMQNLREAVDKAGFVLFATASPRCTTQHFFVRDESKTFKLIQQEGVAAKAA